VSGPCNGTWFAWLSGAGCSPSPPGSPSGCSWAASRLLARFLFEVSPLDPLAYAAAIGLLGAAAALACYLPSRRVARIEAMPLLKSE